MIKQLIRSYVLLVAVAILLFTVPVAFTLTAQLRGDTEVSVEREATTMALLLGSGDTASCQALERMAAPTPGRPATRCRPPPVPGARRPCPAPNGTRR